MNLYESTGRSSVSPHRQSRPATGCTSTMSVCTTLRGSIILPRMGRTTRFCRRNSGQRSKAMCGKTGTRNYVGILTSVNCSATVAKLIAEEVNRSEVLRDFPAIDGVVSFVHGTGCGMAHKGEPLARLGRTRGGEPHTP